MTDLDLESQRAAQSILRNAPDARDMLENVATKTLGVLQENGVYAAVLYTFTRTEKQQKAAADAIRKGLLAMAPRLELQSPQREDARTVLRYLTDSVCSDLNRMLLVKQVWEQALIYTRFGAKAEKHS